jgi:hypothetical protein
MMRQNQRVKAERFGMSAELRHEVESGEFMDKTKISAKEVFDDIRSGIGDVALMKKFKLSEKGLRSLYKKLSDNDPETHGRISDIAEKGLKIKGITARTGDVKTLVVQEEPFGEFASFTFNAECRWSAPDAQGSMVTGFEIAHISMGCLRELKLLIHLAQFSHNHRKQ